MELEKVNLGEDVKRFIRDVYEGKLDYCDYSDEFLEGVEKQLEELDKEKYFRERIENKKIRIFYANLNLHWPYDFMNTGFRYTCNFTLYSPWFDTIILTGYTPPEKNDKSYKSEIHEVMHVIFFHENSYLNSKTDEIEDPVEKFNEKLKVSEMPEMDSFNEWSAALTSYLFFPKVYADREVTNPKYIGKIIAFQVKPKEFMDICMDSKNLKEVETKIDGLLSERFNESKLKILSDYFTQCEKKVRPRQGVEIPYSVKELEKEIELLGL